MSRIPDLASRSPSLRNRPAWPSSTCCKALGNSSRQVLTSLQLASVKARHMDKKGSRSRPMAGSTSRPSNRHSPAASYDLYDIASIKDVNTSTSQNAGS